MLKGKKKWWYAGSAFVFIIYTFAAARPVPRETVLKPRWITSLESSYPVELNGGTSGEEGEQTLLSFRLGNHFGYVEDNGKFALNRTRRHYVSLSENYWAEYEAYPSSLGIMTPREEPVMTIENTRGYPLFLNGRVFVVGSEQNSLTAIGEQGEELWTFDFPAPLTCVDAAGGFVLAGTLDGVVLLLNSSGVPVQAPFEPGGSRLSVILGCAISRDASRLAVISGVDNQRFLLLERAGDSYKVTYHEFLSEGFREPTHISFVDNDSKVAYEREGGLTIYDLITRASTNLALEGKIEILDDSGEDNYLYVITSQGSDRKRFIVIKYPASVINEAPFRSGSAFFARRGRRLFIGGDETMASLILEKK